MKKIKYIVVTILLGALGSAFWEVCLKKVITLIFNTFMPYMLNFLNDSFYTRVSQSINSPSFYSFSYLMLLFALFIMMPPNYFFKFLYGTQKDKINKILHNVYRYSLLFVLLYNFIMIATASQTARETIYNIEIVAPYINDIEYKQLRSDFFQMDSKSDYENLIEKLESIAEEYCLKLK